MSYKLLYIYSLKFISLAFTFIKSLHTLLQKFCVIYILLAVTT